MTIKHHDLASIDLNLLVALDALLTERSVTRAAGQVGIGQSAMSSSLARLRKLMGDELLTRAPDGMQLTPRAMALVEPVRAALRQFQGIVLREDTFDPATVERAFTIAVPGSVESYLVPRLLAFLRSEAPGVRLTLRALDYGTVQSELDADQIDLGIGIITQGQAHLKLRALYRFGYLCLFNADLLGVPTPISLDDYLRFPHIMTSMSGTDRGVVDVALAAIGRQRRLVATPPGSRRLPFTYRPRRSSRPWSMNSRRVLLRSSVSRPAPCRCHSMNSPTPWFGTPLTIKTPRTDGCARSWCVSAGRPRKIMPALPCDASAGHPAVKVRQA
jgi:DNA-binding transcriptional LysR family regulator